MRFDKRTATWLVAFLAVLLAIGASFNYTRNRLKTLQSSVDRSAAPKTINTTQPWDYYWTIPEKRIVLIQRNERIAHAGGALNGETYTNSIDALEANKAHFDLFEIDMAFTSDGELVCSHDWIQYPKKIFGKALESAPTLAEFLALTDANERFTNCTIETLTKWLDNNPQASIVTDLKSENIRGLTYISEKYPNHVGRFKPQIYNMDQYATAKKLGFDDIILTIYRWRASDDDIVQSTRSVKLFAVTVPHFRAPSIAKRLKKAGNRVYAHTINSNETLSYLRWFEVDEIYTDTLIE